MSERMIEIQRAKMGLPPMTAAGSSVTTTAPANAQAATVAGMINARLPVNATAAVPPTPQQAAAAAMLAEEEQMQSFLQKIQGRDDNMSTEEGGGPTVPTALSRRMMQRQGVGYLDETVSAVASASADRFLATVLQQAVACRDQRLKGAELAREHARKRRRHLKQYRADTDDRQRRKQAREEERRKSNLAKIEEAKNLGKPGSVSNATSPPKSKKKKKKNDATGGTNGNKKSDAKKGLDEEDESSEDSLDEEESYYNDFYGEDSGDSAGEEAPNEDEDDTRETLLLRDLVPPLEAWGVHLTGKLGVGVAPIASSDDEASDEEGNEGVADSEQTKDVGNENGENPPSPSNAKAPQPSPSSNNEKKPAEASESAASANRTSTPALSARSQSPVPKPP